MLSGIFKITEVKYLNPTDWNGSQDCNFIRCLGKSYPEQLETFEGLAFRGCGFWRPRNKKKYSICNTLPLNKLNESYFCIILTLLFHMLSPSLYCFPANILQVGYFSSCPRSNNKSEMNQRRVLRRPCRESALSVCLHLNRDVLSLIWVNMWTWKNKLLSIQHLQRFRALSF